MRALIIGYAVVAVIAMMLYAIFAPSAPAVDHECPIADTQERG